ncbi:MAG: amino acid--tRNA ligase-related protein [bacterium]|nr:amino acid--tRNA ligase-related protein [bacterium]
MTRTLIKETPKKIDQEVNLQGWVRTRRDMGKIIFVDLRDRSGLIQVVFTPEKKELLAKAEALRPEFVVSLIGKVNKRPVKMVNTKLETGTVELEALDLEILSAAKTPPFEVDKDTFDVDEELRLKYRYLDLRTERLQKNIRLRSDFVRKAREFLFQNDFTEIETPLLTKSTPEGSRDFIVPSRLRAGKFFALPQSPQQYKQLLMTAGFERYFQIARAVRDEDLRADRGFEHTQIDIEMSFVEREEVLQILEEMMIKVAEDLGYKIKQKPFPRVSYKDAIKKYGADKFDLRAPEEKKQNVLAYAWVIDFPFFEKTDEDKWTFTHNPFSMPLPEYLEDHLAGKNIGRILTSQYDLVCNGYETGGGSIRAHRPEILRATYKIMGYSDAEIQESVGHMLEAFEYGTPPHGGIALGVERNIMNLAREDYLREVQAFPMSSSGHTSVMDAPAELTEKQLKEAHIKVVH